MAWLFGRSRRDLDEEMRSHLAMAERDRVDRGESAGQLQRAVLADGMTVTMVGLVFGSVAAYVLMTALSSLQYGVTARDPLTWAGVVLTLLSAAIACWPPARQAMCVDPAALLREE